MAPKPKDPFLGTTLGGKYKLVERLGEGGMGAVYKAEHTLIKRTVAIKLLHSHAVVNEEKRLRFQKEAEVTSQISHPNAVTLYDFGIEDYPYIVMEYVEGQTLSELLDEGPLSLEKTLSITKDICGALQAAHELGIVHRDLKPENIMLARTADGSAQVKVLDFGLSKIVREDYDQATLTQDGAIMGTPRYMSPEQARGKEPDKRSDIYCLGLLVYEMLSGRPTFSAESSIEIVQMQVVVDPEPLSELDIAPPISEAVSDVVIKALAKNAEDRQPDVQTFLSELTNAARSREDVTLLDIKAQPDTIPPPLSPSKRAGEENRLTGLVLIVAALMVIAASGVLIYTNLEKFRGDQSEVVAVQPEEKEAVQVAEVVEDKVTIPEPTLAPQPTKELEEPARAMTPPPAQAPTPAPTARQTTPAPPKGWYIQALDKLSLKVAKEKQQILKSNDFPAELEQTTHRGRTVYNVLVGPFGSMISAQVKNKDVQKVLGTNSLVTTIKPVH